MSISQVYMNPKDPHFRFIRHCKTFVHLILFLVGAFSFYGNMPDYCSDLFFLQTTDLTLIGPLFTETTKTTKAKSGQRKLSAKGPHFIFYFFKRNLQNRTRLKVTLLDVFRHCATFFAKIFDVSKGPPSNFLIFCN